MRHFAVVGLKRHGCSAPARPNDETAGGADWRSAEDSVSAS